MLPTPQLRSVIDTRTPHALIRAHVHAIRSGELSLMTGSSTPRLLHDILSMPAGVKIYSDRADQLDAAPLKVLAVHDLPAPTALPDLSPDTPIAAFYTSGSTGQPQCNVRSWSSLHGEAQRVADTLGVSRGVRLRFAATLPLEHMYGYMFGFLVPYLYELAISERQVTYPADLAAYLTSSDVPAWIVTTPTHLRLYSQCATRFTNVERVICGAGPLSKELAVTAARVFSAPVTEFYGSTETGAVASREWRDHRANLWTCLNGMSVSVDEHANAFASAPHFAQPIALADLLELHSETQFRVIGRATDLVKIAGKRASLADLNRRLLEAPGIRDGTFYMPHTDDELSRLAAFVVLNEDASKLDVMEYLRVHLDNVFLPRPLIDVPALPRNAVGKLTRNAIAELYEQAHTLTQKPSVYT
jgi:acyl-coenzyme A synthetase/AMP-(fatty) acid ligase